MPGKTVIEQFASMSRPEDNPTCQGLKDAQDANGKKPAVLSGAVFDKACAENEAAHQKAVDDAVRNTLIAGAQNRHAVRAILRPLPWTPVAFCNAISSVGFRQAEL
jgi:hypothetical protein